MDKIVMLEYARALLKGVSDLPTIPEVATRVLSLLDRQDVELDEVADLILTDQVLAARVLKIVNSPLYRPSQEIQSVKRALIYLGLRHIRELVLTCSFINAFEGKDGVIGIKAFWEHSFGVGVVARIIAQRIRYPDPEKAYIAGMVHDIGEVFLSHYKQKEFQEIIDRISECPQSLAQAEMEWLGTTHCEIGFCIAEQWNFPDVYREVIACHHEPEEAVIDPQLTAIVNLADLFCLVRQLDYGGKEWISFSLADEKGWEIVQQHASHMENFDAERFCYELDDRIEEIQELVRSIFQ